jgi:hypothetical protein
MPKRFANAGEGIASMLDEEFPIPLDDDVTRIAVITVLVGSMLIRFAHWVSAGWVIIAFGILTLWLAHQLAIAPECDESAEWLRST